MASRIALCAGLPAPLTRALGAWQSGTVIKVLLRYDRAFWRDRGLSGMVMWRDLPDCSPATSARMRSPGAGRLHRRPLALRWRALGAGGDARGDHRPADRGARPGGGGVHRDDARATGPTTLERRRLQRPHRRHGCARCRSSCLRRRAAGAFRLVGTVAVLSGLCRGRDRRRAHRGAKKCDSARSALNPPSPPARRDRSRGGSARRPACRRRRNRWSR